MPRRFLPTLVALFLPLPLFACGNPSSDTASEPAAQDEPATDQAALPGEGAESGGYEEIDRSGEQVQGEQTAPRAISTPQPAPAQPAAQRRPIPPRTATPAVGAGVQGDVELFYDALDRDGSWVPHPDYNYVWIPSRMGPGWRPYQEGRWIWTTDYGWYWESEEPSAWAVYHYGRWDYDPDYGWFWVPGDIWAPAWVTWRVGGGSVGWAPIAPDRPGFATGVPRRYAPPVAESWVFVQTPYFAERDVAPHVLPMSQIGPSLEAARDIRTPRFERDRVVNYGAPPDEMRPYLRGPVETRQLVYVGNRDDRFDDLRGNRVGIYRPIIGPGGRAGPPPRVADVEQTRRVVILDFTSPGPGRLYDAPSVALLDVLDAQERQRLGVERLNAKQAAVDARIDQLQRERAAMIEARRKQAQKLEAKIAKERDQARAERKRLREIARAEMEKRAAKIKVQAPMPEETAVQTPPPEAPAPNAVAPGEPAPVAPKDVVPPAPPVETGAIEDAAKPAPEPKQEPAPETSAAAPTAEPAPPPPMAPQPAPMPAVEPQPGPAPEPQQAEVPPAAEPATQPRQDGGEGNAKRNPLPGAAAVPDAAGAPAERAGKRKRPSEAAIPDQAPPAEAPAVVEPAPPPQAMEPPPPPPEVPGPPADMPSDPAAAAAEHRVSPSQAPPEAVEQAVPLEGTGETDAPPQ